MKKLLIFSLSLTVIFSCEKAELPVPKHDPGKVINASADMDPDYKWQLYYDLKTNKVVGKNLKTAWDLGFENGANGFHIILNSAKAMYAYPAGTDFEAISDTVGLTLNKRWDASSGNLDSTAIGDWKNETNCFIIDRGYNESGIHQGFKKIRFISSDESAYQVRFADLNGNNEKTLTIQKDDTYNFSFLSFTSGNTLLIEPPKDTWDLVFTQYTHIFHEPQLTPYLVTGCLTNRYNTQACLVNEVDFENIDFGTASAHLLSSAIDRIGYTWKI